MDNWLLGDPREKCNVPAKRTWTETHLHVGKYRDTYKTASTRREAATGYQVWFGNQYGLDYEGNTTTG